MSLLTSRFHVIFLYAVIVLVGVPCRASASQVPRGPGHQPRPRVDSQLSFTKSVHPFVRFLHASKYPLAISTAVSAAYTMRSQLWHFAQQTPGVSHVIDVASRIDPVELQQTIDPYWGLAEPVITTAGPVFAAVAVAATAFRNRVGIGQRLRHMFNLKTGESRKLMFDIEPFNEPGRFSLFMIDNRRKGTIYLNFGQEPIPDKIEIENSADFRTFVHSLFANHPTHLGIDWENLVRQKEKLMPKGDFQDMGVGEVRMGKADDNSGEKIRRVSEEIATLPLSPTQPLNFGGKRLAEISPYAANADEWLDMLARSTPEKRLFNQAFLKKIQHGEAPDRSVKIRYLDVPTGKYHEVIMNDKEQAVAFLERLTKKKLETPPPPQLKKRRRFWQWWPKAKDR